MSDPSSAPSNPPAESVASKPTAPSAPPQHRAARALHPAARDEVFLPEPLPIPSDHPELDLFGRERFRQLSETEKPTAPLTVPCPTPRPPSPSSEPAPMRARMLNEFVYCPRLFYYEEVEGLFLSNADTERGAALHEKVDRGKGALPKARKKAKTPVEAKNTDSSNAPATDQPTSDATSTTTTSTTESAAADTSPSAVGASQVEETLHSRSAMLSSTRLGVVAKMDLIEVKLTAPSAAELFGPDSRQTVTPVDYKAGAPQVADDASQLWDADKMQLGLQILILRDNGYTCDDGVIFYRATRQRVRLEMTAELEGWIIQKIAEARATAAAPTLPPPLINSPKCVRCSLAPICLPDETRMLRNTPRLEPIAHPTPSASAALPRPKTDIPPPRRLIAARDDERALYLNTPGYRVGIQSGRLIVKDGAQTVDEIRLQDVSHVALFGNIQLTTQALHELCEQEIPIAYFSMGGWFYGLTRGHGLKNVHTRIRQFATAANPVQCLELAQNIVRAKIRNHRTLLMRLHVEPPRPAIIGLKEIAARVGNTRGLDELLGMEGAAAALYFQHFPGMIKVGEDDIDDEIPGLEDPATTAAQRREESAQFSFDFTQRRRRPPTDPVNALLSLAYSLLAKDCTIAALAVGFDPYVGFYHQPRHGRPALALDLMEEFRPLIAESTVLTAINNRMITPGHFVRAGDAVNLTPHGRRAFFHAYEQRMNALITHPVFDYKVSYRRVLELQARLLARWLTGEIPDYIPMVTR
ncbi:MAG: CRISPR-associated endonuclease Cas1 [Verrucomicrobiales bacterium]|nr:CRISPR-associated endonuclease Cas1 [Verrucomicrobiales bacterium]